jgi:hypothetical protein
MRDGAGIQLHGGFSGEGDETVCRSARFLSRYFFAFDSWQKQQGIAFRQAIVFFLLEYQLGVSSGWISCVNSNVMQQLLPRNLLAIRRRNALVQAQTPLLR